MRMLNACTTELDDIDLAVAEIREQLALESNLLQNAAGFLSCSYDFIELGVAQAIAEALPFDVVGCTTLACAGTDDAGVMMLTVSVLTADDCAFHSVYTDPLPGEPEAAIRRACRRAQEALPEAPGMVLAFMPMTPTVSGEQMLQILDASLDGAPVFGMLACDFDTSKHSNSFTFHNAEVAGDRLAALFISGNFAPEFFLASASEERIQKQMAMITKSSGNLLIEINNLPAREYFSSIGLAEGSGAEALSSIPVMVNYSDGTEPVARAVLTLNEDGTAICGGAMPEGATLSFGTLDMQDIMHTARQTTGAMLGTGKRSGMILLPCLGRNMTLGADPLAEIDAVGELVGGALPWHLAYSGGEVCPVKNASGRYLNRFHNFTFIGCIF